jgi:hypothetical protein
MINITIIFPQLLRCWLVAKFLTIRERRQFESIATSWAKPLSHARTSLYFTRVGYRSPYSKMSLDRATRPGGRLMPGSSDHAWPRSTSPLRFVSRLPAMRTTVQTHLERGTWLHGRNELSGRYVQGTFNLNQGPDNGMILKRHRRDKTYTQDLHVLLHIQIPIPPDLQLFIITWFISMITIVANHDSVATYISWMTGITRLLPV